MKVYGVMKYHKVLHVWITKNILSVMTVIMMGSVSGTFTKPAHGDLGCLILLAVSINMD
jgi:hypothetical protein